MVKKVLEKNLHKEFVNFFTLQKKISQIFKSHNVFKKYFKG